MAGKPWTEERKTAFALKVRGSGNHFYGKKHNKETIGRLQEASRWADDDFTYANLTDQQKEILDGILLADGSLDSSPTSARITYGCKFTDTLELLINSFTQIHFTPIWQSPKTLCYHVKSSYCKDLLDYKNRWYPNHIKEVPNDILITPQSCYWWFIGDGGQVSYGLQLCTDAFNQQSIDILLTKLKENNFHCTHNRVSNRIRIASRSRNSFLKWINIANIPSQNYKWINKGCKHV